MKAKCKALAETAIGRALPASDVRFINQQIGAQLKALAQSTPATWEALNPSQRMRRAGSLAAREVGNDARVDAWEQTDYDALKEKAIGVLTKAGAILDLEIVEKTGQKGRAYATYDNFNRLIELSLKYIHGRSVNEAMKNLEGVLTHELVHWAKATGVISSDRWAKLEEATNSLRITKSAAKRHGVEIDPKGKLPTYMEIARRVYKNDSEATIIEEAVTLMMQVERQNVVDRIPAQDAHPARLALGGIISVGRHIGRVFETLTDGKKKALRSHMEQTSSLLLKGSLARASKRAGKMPKGMDPVTVPKFADHILETYSKEEVDEFAAAIASGNPIRIMSSKIFDSYERGHNGQATLDTVDFKTREYLGQDGKPSMGLEAMVKSVVRKAATYGKRGKKPAAKQHRAIIITGAPGVGKTRIGQETAKASGSAYINNDNIFDHIPEYRNGQGYYDVIDEANMIAREAMNELTEDGTNIIVENTGDNLSAMANLVASFRDRGYLVDVIHVKPEGGFRQRIINAAKRFATSGRWVRTSDQLNIGESPTTNHVTVASSFHMDGGVDGAVTVEVESGSYTLVAKSGHLNPGTARAVRKATGGRLAAIRKVLPGGRKLSKEQQDQLDAAVEYYVKQGMSVTDAVMEAKRDIEAWENLRQEVIMTGRFRGQEELRETFPLYTVSIEAVKAKEAQFTADALQHQVDSLKKQIADIDRAVEPVALRIERARLQAESQQAAAVTKEEIEEAKGLSRRTVLGLFAGAAASAGMPGVNLASQAGVANAEISSIVNFIMSPEAAEGYFFEPEAFKLPSWFTEYMKARDGGTGLVSSRGLLHDLIRATVTKNSRGDTVGPNYWETIDSRLYEPLEDHETDSRTELAKTIDDAVWNHNARARAIWQKYDDVPGGVPKAVADQANAEYQSSKDDIAKKLSEQFDLIRTQYRKYTAKHLLREAKQQLEEHKQSAQRDAESDANLEFALAYADAYMSQPERMSRAEKMGHTVKVYRAIVGEFDPEHKAEKRKINFYARVPGVSESYIAKRLLERDSFDNDTEYHEGGNMMPALLKLGRSVQVTGMGKDNFSIPLISIKEKDVREGVRARLLFEARQEGIDVDGNEFNSIGREWGDSQDPNAPPLDWDEDFEGEFAGVPMGAGANTDQIAIVAQELGYDSVVFRSITDGGAVYTAPSTVYATLNDGVARSIFAPFNPYEQGFSESRVGTVDDTPSNPSVFALRQEASELAHATIAKYPHLREAARAAGLTKNSKFISGAQMMRLEAALNNPPENIRAEYEGDRRDLIVEMWGARDGQGFGNAAASANMPMDTMQDFSGTQTLINPSENSLIELGAGPVTIVKDAEGNVFVTNDKGMQKRQEVKLFHGSAMALRGIRPSLFATSHAKTAEFFAKRDKARRGGEARVTPLAAEFSNPKVVEGNGQIIYHAATPSGQTPSWDMLYAQIDKAIEDGHDVLIMENVLDGPEMDSRSTFAEPVDIYIVLDPTKVRKLSPEYLHAGPVTKAIAKVFDSFQSFMNKSPSDPITNDTQPFVKKLRSHGIPLHGVNVYRGEIIENAPDEGPVQAGRGSWQQRLSSGPHAERQAAYGQLAEDTLISTEELKQLAEDFTGERVRNLRTRQAALDVIRDRVWREAWDDEAAEIIRKRGEQSRGILPRHMLGGDAGPIGGKYSLSIPLPYEELFHRNVPSQLYSAEDFVEAVRSKYGEDANKAIKSGRITFVESIYDVPQEELSGEIEPDAAGYTSSSGRVYVFTSKALPEDVDGLLAHELGVHNMNEILPEQEMSAVLDQVDTLLNGKDKDILRGLKLFNESKSKETGYRRLEEILAYAVQSAPNLETLGIGMHDILNRVLAAVRLWLGDKFPALLENLSFNDMQYMARGAMLSSLRSKPGINTAHHTMTAMVESDNRRTPTLVKKGMYALAPRATPPAAPGGAGTGGPTGTGTPPSRPPSGRRPKTPSGQRYTPPGYRLGSLNAAQQLAEKARDEVLNRRTRTMWGETIPDLHKLNRGILSAADDLDKDVQGFLRVKLAKLIRLIPPMKHIVDRYMPFGGLPDKLIQQVILMYTGGAAERAQDLGEQLAGGLTDAIAAAAEARHKASPTTISVLEAKDNIGREVFEALTDANFISQGMKIMAMPVGLRTATEEARQGMMAVGRQMVEAGTISQKQLDSKFGHYLKRAYKAYLDNYRPGVGMAASGRDYARMRAEIPDDELLAKGEIKDAPLLIYMAVQQSLHDIAVYNYWNAIMWHSHNSPTNPGWFLPGSIAMWRGKTVSMFWLLSVERPRIESEFRTLIDETTDYRNKLKGTAPSSPLYLSKINDIRQLASQLAAIDAKVRANPTYAAMVAKGALPNGYKQLPNSPDRYGDAAGAIVLNDFYEQAEANGILHQEDEQNIYGMGVRAFDSLNRFSKFTRTVANPITHARNLYNNLSALPANGINVGQFVPAVQSMINFYKNGVEDQYIKAARETGQLKAVWTENELRVMDRFLTAVKDQERRNKYMAKLRTTPQNPNTVMKMIGVMEMATAMGIAMGHNYGNFMSKWYQYGDTVFKLAVIMDQMQRGVEPGLAALEARRIYFDYSNARTSIKAVRQTPIAAFISFNYFSLPVILDRYLTAGWRTLYTPSAVSTMMLGTMVMMGLAGADDDDMRKFLRDEQRNNMGLLGYPLRDAHGRYQMIDLAYILPDFTFLNAAMKLGRGDLIGAVGGLGFGGPTWSTAVGLQTNLDTFTGMEIVNPEDDEATKTIQRTYWVLRQVMLPATYNSWLPPLPGEARGGASWESAFGTGLDRRGHPGRDTAAATMRQIGLNLTPIDPNYEFVKRLAEFDRRMSEIRTERTQASTNQSYTEAMREAQQRHWQERLEAVIQERNDYIDDVGVTLDRVQERERAQGNR